jgi:E3 SUMO-protein ligase PIAS1
LREVRDMVPTPVPFPLARSLLEQTSCGGHDQKDQDDDVIIQDKSVISLRCPISGQICRIPVRTRHCKSPAVFDLDTFLELNSKVRKWICPHCGATAQPHEIIIDGFLSRIMGVIRAWEQANPTVWMLARGLPSCRYSP